MPLFVADAEIVEGDRVIGIHGDGPFDALVWQLPSQQAEGVFQCVGFDVDHFGHTLAILNQAPGHLPEQIVQCVLNNLALLYANQARYDEAEPLYREALNMKRKLLGAAHPELAAALTNLAFILQSRGDAAGAERAYREALGMNRKLLGESHPDVAKNMSDLAFVLHAQGKTAQAIALMRGALTMMRAELGPSHPTVAGAASTLAFWLTDARDFSDAERLVNESLSIRRAALGETHPQVGSTLMVKANLRLAERRPEEALQLAERVKGLAQEMERRAILETAPDTPISEEERERLRSLQPQGRFDDLRLRLGA